MGIACVHMSGDMNIVCDIKYAKPTGHVPQLFYDAWHDSRGRSIFRFLLPWYEFIEYLSVAEPVGPKYGSNGGGASTGRMGGHA